MKPFDRDWEFLVANKDFHNFAGSEIVEFPFDAKGVSAKDCFKKYDTSGKIVPCREPELVREVIRCKKAINFQIKMWGAGYYDMGEGLEYYMKEFIDPPSWVAESLLNQIKKAAAPKWIKFDEPKEPDQAPVLPSQPQAMP